MSGIDKITNQPMEIELKGKKYKVSQITMGDYGRLLHYLKELKAKQTAKVLKETGLRPYEIVKTVREILDEDWEEAKMAINPKTGKPFDEKAAERFTARVGGYDSTIYMIYLALKKNHKDITLDEVYDLIPPGESEAFGDVVGYIFGSKIKEDEESKNSPKPKAKK